MSGAGVNIAHDGSGRKIKDTNANIWRKKIENEK